MSLRKLINTDNLIRVMMILLFCSFTVLITYSWGRYVMLACIAVIFTIDGMKNRFKYKQKCVLGRFLVTIALFAVYAFISAIWATDSTDAITTAKTLFEILLMMFVVYNYYYRKENSASEVLLVIKLSSFIIVLYSILFYGMDNLIQMTMMEERLENSYANVNTIGMLAAIGCLIQLDEIIRDKKFKLSGLFCIPAVFMLALTQSRKALAILLIGIVMIFILRNIDSKDFRKKVVRVLGSIIVLGIFIYLLLSLPVFSGMIERMEGLVAIFSDVGEVDSSTRLRTEMITVGLEQFLKTPLFGIGMGNTHHLAEALLGKDSYLHNNFIELLAGGGIFGFVIYYSMYLYLFKEFWKYRKNKNNAYVICLVIMLILFVMDYAMVSYYNKSRYIFLMLYFLEVRELKKMHQKSVQERILYNDNK